MGEAELIEHKQQLIIHAVIILYGDAANEILASDVSKDITDHWNAPNGNVRIKHKNYHLRFNIKGVYDPHLIPETVLSNTDPRNNYFRVEEYAHTDISFVDGINSNTGYFKLTNLLGNSTTAAHEYGHTLGLVHPHILDIRGQGTPGIMYPRGTIVDPAYQYNSAVAPLEPGGTINPHTRRVLQGDIDDLHLEKLRFDRNGKAIVGDFTSQWHEKHLP